MVLAQLGTRIDKKVKQAVEKTCKTRGLKMNRFVEDAIIDKLEEMEDLEDLEALRKEPRRLLADILKEMK